MLMEFEFWVGILATLGFIWCLTSFGKFVVYIIELIRNNKNYE